MKSNNSLCFFISLLFLMHFGVLDAAGDDWEHIFVSSNYNINSLEKNGMGDEIYLSTEEGLFFSVNMGKSWEKAVLPAGVNNVDMAKSDGAYIYLIAEGRVYYSKDTVFNKRLGMEDNISGIELMTVSDVATVPVVWSAKRIFKIIDSRYIDITPGQLSSSITDIDITDGNILISSGNDIFCSIDKGISWFRETLISGGSREDIYENSLDENADEDLDYSIPGVRTLDRMNKRDLLAASGKGVYVLDNRGRVLEKIDTTGMPSSDVMSVSGGMGEIYTATYKNIFVRDDQNRGWITVFDRKDPGKIVGIKCIKFSNAEWFLFAVSNKNVYRIKMSALRNDFEERGINRIFEKGKSEEPTIQEVQNMAIHYAEVSPEKIKRWRKGARWKAIFPRLSLGFSESNNDNMEIYKSSTSYYVVNGPNEIDRDWSIDLTWDLSDLVWNDAQTSIDVRSKLMVQLRDDILEEVTRLYFERKKLLMEIAGEGRESHKTGVDEKAIIDKRLRIEELTAYIDAITGGQFSSSISGSREMTKKS
jgi:hypothetical protein